MSENDSKKGGLPAFKADKTVPLPTGATAEIRKGKGRDLMYAHRAVGNNDDPMAIAFSLIAELVQIDGKQIVYEQVLEMPLPDVMTLVNEVMGANFQFPRPPVLPGSSSSGSARGN